MRKRLLFWIFLLSAFLPALRSQSSSPFHYEYATILLDSTYSAHENVKMAKYIAHLKKQLSAQMDVVIGKSTTTLSSFPPASPLSNLLTDILLQFGNQYCQEKHDVNADVSLLNWGGIRTAIPEGEITIGTIYQISPFENNVVVLEMKGKELLRIFDSFTLEKNQPYAGLQIIYQNNRPVKWLINGEEIESEKVYRLVTVDFIMTGGDRIIPQDAIFENTFLTGSLLRDVIIDGIRKITAQGKAIEPDGNNE
ncbi:5'-nucleotidase C-terminal domain-containing protein [Bacteroidales bacterium OttesenSCG-928-L19]|nr:5'-nucleotidase C-terminal domain-containing protein [Bacteroidales bacterium OttesenSCG-928-L19]